jgi:hypothetical protein
VVNKCWLCESDGESVDLLLHCKVKNAMWNVILSCLGLSWVMPSSVKELMACWYFGGSHKECSSLEDDSFMSYVVYLEGT